MRNGVVIDNDDDISKQKISQALKPCQYNLTLNDADSEHRRPCNDFNAATCENLDIACGTCKFLPFQGHQENLKFLDLALNALTLGSA